jgi:hypothetical protein
MSEFNFSWIPLIGSFFLKKNAKITSNQLPDVISARVQVLSGTDSGLASQVLALGEIAAPTDKTWLRRGDGVNAGGVKIGVSPDNTQLTGDVVVTGADLDTIGTVTVRSPVESTIANRTCKMGDAIDISDGVDGVDGYGQMTPGTIEIKDAAGFVFQFNADRQVNINVVSPNAAFMGHVAVRVPVPANSSSAGRFGFFASDNSYFYFYGATGWRRIVGLTF